MLEAFKCDAFFPLVMLVVVSCMTGETEGDEFRLCVPGIALVLMSRVQVDEVRIAASTHALLKLLDTTMLACPASTLFTGSG